MSAKRESGFAVLPDLTGGGDDIAATFDRFAKALESSGLRGIVQFLVSDGKQQKTFAVHLENGSVRVESKGVSLPDLEIITTAETWRGIASGAVSPLDAFTGGRMRVRGANISLGPRVLQHLSSGRGRADIC